MNGEWGTRSKLDYGITDYGNAVELGVILQPTLSGGIPADYKDRRQFTTLPKS